MRADNENTPLTFVSLAALTANVTRNLRLEIKKDGTAETDGNGKDRQQERSKAELDRAYIEQRERDIRAFERRFRKN